MTSEFLPFHVPAIGEEEIQSVVETLRSGWLTTGPKVKSFEQEFAAVVGSRHGVAVNSGTGALHLALDAVGIEAGDEVVVPTMTFAATAEVVLYFKARPVLVDCRQDTLNIAVDDLQKKITPKTKAMIPVHFGGQACEMDEILAIAKNHNIKVIEDAAHALPARYRGRMVGTMGDITCFSFYATKTITTGEGGMSVTDNHEYAERMRLMSLHGISKDAWKRYAADGSWYYEIMQPGYKYNLTDLAAAIGLEQLKKCDLFWEARKRIARSYDEGFQGVTQMTIPRCQPGVEHAWHLYVIQLNLERLRINRDEFIEILKTKNIGTSVHFIPLHLHPYYRDSFGYTPRDFPNASAAFKRIISLPIFPSMTAADIDNVIAAVTSTAHEYRKC